MKKLLFGLMVVMGISVIAEAQYYVPWYAKNPVFNNVTIGGTLNVTGATSYTGASLFKSNLYVGSSLALAGFTVTPSGVVVASGTMRVSGALTASASLLTVGEIQNLTAVGGATMVVMGESSGNQDGRIYIAKNGTPRIQIAADLTAGALIKIDNSNAYVSTWTATGLYLNAAAGLARKTIAQVKAIDPVWQGEMYYVSDSVPPSIYVSTGTALLDWGKISLGTID